MDAPTFSETAGMIDAKRSGYKDQFVRLFVSAVGDSVVRFESDWVGGTITADLTSEQARFLGRKLLRMARIVEQR